MAYDDGSPSRSLEGLKASADDAKAKSEKEHRRNLEVRASFYDKLAALDAGSIALAVSVGVALTGKSGASFSFLHSNLSWLSVIAFFLWASLIFSLCHNWLFVKIARLQADQAEAWSNYLDLISTRASAHAVGVISAAEALDKLLADTQRGRITRFATNMQKTDLSVTWVVLLGNAALLSFLIAYTVILIWVVRLWWFTR